MTRNKKPNLYKHYILASSPGKAIDFQLKAKLPVKDSLIVADSGQLSFINSQPTVWLVHGWETAYPNAEALKQLFNKHDIHVIKAFL